MESKNRRDTSRRGGERQKLIGGEGRTMDKVGGEMRKQKGEREMKN